MKKLLFQFLKYVRYLQLSYFDGNLEYLHPLVQGELQNIVPKMKRRIGTCVALTDSGCMFSEDVRPFEYRRTLVCADFEKSGSNMDPSIILEWGSPAGRMMVTWFKAAHFGISPDLIWKFESRAQKYELSEKRKYRKRLSL